MDYKIPKIYLSLRAKRSNPVDKQRDCFVAEFILSEANVLLAMTLFPFVIAREVASRRLTAAIPGLLAIVVFLLLILPINVRAVGVSVSPAKLEMKISIGEESESELTIKNASSDVSLFEVYLDDFESFIKIRPASFILESQEERGVKVKINAQEAGKYTTKISVVAKSLNKKEFQIGSGVKIPLEIEAGENKKLQLSDFILGKIGIIKIPFYLIVIFLILLFLIGYIYFLKRKIKKLNKKEFDDL